jgi:hypothetical protein
VLGCTQSRQRSDDLHKISLTIDSAFRKHRPDLAPHCINGNTDILSDVFRRKTVSDIGSDRGFSLGQAVDLLGRIVMRQRHLMRVDNRHERAGWRINCYFVRLSRERINSHKERFLISIR